VLEPLFLQELMFSKKDSSSDHHSRYAVSAFKSCSYVCKNSSNSYLSSSFKNDNSASLGGVMARSSSPELLKTKKPHASIATDTSHVISKLIFLFFIFLLMLIVILLL